MFVTIYQAACPHKPSKLQNIKYELGLNTQAILGEINYEDFSRPILEPQLSYRVPKLRTSFARLSFVSSYDEKSLNNRQCCGLVSVLLNFGVYKVML